MTTIEDLKKKQEALTLQIERLEKLEKITKGVENADMASLCDVILKISAATGVKNTEFLEAVAFIKESIGTETLTQGIELEKEIQEEEPTILTHDMSCSEWISHSIYNKDTKELTIVLKSELELYRYNVPYEMWEDFISASSYGQYYHKWLKLLDE